MDQLVAVFVDAALPQKAVFAVLGLSVPAALIVSARDFRRVGLAARPSAFVSELRIAGPALGLLTAALDGFHMARTTLRLSYAPTPAMLAPGVMEVASLAGLGALAGLVAVVLHSALGRRRTETNGDRPLAQSATPGQLDHGGRPA